MPRSILPLLSLAVLAGCGRDESPGTSGTSAGSAPPASNARRIPGGTSVTFGGVTFDIPPEWKFQESQGSAVLIPANAVRDEELYLLVSDPQSRSFDSATVDRSVGEVVEKLNPKARRKGSPEDRTFGDVKGREYRFTATLDNGRKGEYRVFAFNGERDSALLAIGLKDRLEGRRSELDAIVSSMARAAPAPVSAATGSSKIRPELAGQWIWITDFSANNGGGRQTDTTLTLHPDGRFQYHYNHVSSNPFGASWGSESAAGTWTATETTITFTDRSGSRTCRLEKRNHPKNVNDPMIVLDGKAFVTATLKAPW